MLRYICQFNFNYKIYLLLLIIVTLQFLFLHNYLYPDIIENTFKIELVNDKPPLPIYKCENKTTNDITYFYKPVIMISGKQILQQSQNSKCDILLKVQYDNIKMEKMKAWIAENNNYVESLLETKLNVKVRFVVDDLWSPKEVCDISNINNPIEIKDINLTKDSKIYIYYLIEDTFFYKKSFQKNHKVITEVLLNLLSKCIDLKPIDIFHKLEDLFNENDFRNRFYDGLSSFTQANEYEILKELINNDLTATIENIKTSIISLVHNYILNQSSLKNSVNAFLKENNLPLLNENIFVPKNLKASIDDLKIKYILNLLLPLSFWNEIIKNSILPFLGLNYDNNEKKQIQATELKKPVLTLEFPQKENPIYNNSDGLGFKLNDICNLPNLLEEKVVKKVEAIESTTVNYSTILDTPSNYQSNNNNNYSIYEYNEEFKDTIEPNNKKSDDINNLYRKWFNYYKSQYKVAKKNNNYEERFKYIFLIADLYFEAKRYDKAKNIYLRNLKKEKARNYLFKYENVGDIYDTNNDFNNAIKSYLIALNYFFYYIDSSWNEQIRILYKLCNCYLKNKEVCNAYDSLIAITELEKSISHEVDLERLLTLKYLAKKCSQSFDISDYDKNLKNGIRHFLEENRDQDGITIIIDGDSKYIINNNDSIIIDNKDVFDSFEDEYADDDNYYDYDYENESADEASSSGSDIQVEVIEED